MDRWINVLKSGDENKMTPICDGCIEATIAPFFFNTESMQYKVCHNCKESLMRIAIRNGNAFFMGRIDTNGLHNSSRRNTI